MDLCPVETTPRKTTTHSPRVVPTTAITDDGTTEHPTNHAANTVMAVAVLIAVLSAASVAALVFLKLRKVMKNHPRCVPTPVPLINTDLNHSECSREPNIELGFMQQQPDPSKAIQGVAESWEPD
ncbi:uncharacterized protein LOC124288122 isoform X2 [Haliotis rubra]|nr:uncharacterized protein LOC124288122 isoform X2 [Haliotis rubra]XP_046580646.1 uncharacterized protein LOC124288122 isoform X2 [Haliotis rubra]